jgi:hypothetical protein
MKTFTIVAVAFAVVACSQPTKPEADPATSTFEKGTFGYDLNFLSSRDSLIVLKDVDAQVIVSPGFQGKVFTSTAQGSKGKSFGWINYNVFDKEPDPHMNAYGGENRLWLGPEGNKFSLFFEPGKAMEFENWKTPPAFDLGPWRLVSATEKEVAMHQDATLINYQGTELKIGINRTVRLLSRNEIAAQLNIDITERDAIVGYSTTNEITNAGDHEWTRKSGAPCIWILDMFTPSPGTTIVIPYKEHGEGKIVTSDYFGEISADRLTVSGGRILFTADGKSRGKIGVSPKRARTIAGSYNAQDGVLTVVTFDVDSAATYLNQEWNTNKDPFSGDAVNAYNDGPLTDGTQMGPFYELESVSPAALLAPGSTMSHRHNVFHITGNKDRVKSLYELLFPPVKNP